MLTLAPGRRRQPTDVVSPRHGNGSVAVGPPDHARFGQISTSLRSGLMAAPASKTEAIEAAVRAYLSADSTARLRALAGGIEIVDVSAEMRPRDRST